jgi:HSP20 family molecular chaperone IbpA
MDFVIRPRLAGFEPSADVFVDEERGTVVVSVDIAGADPESLRVEIDEGHLLISGRRPKPERSRLCSLVQKEIAYGDFVKRIHLPIPVEYDGANATYDDGMLVIALVAARETYLPTARTEVRLILKRVPW